MKYILKKDLPLAKAGEEVSLVKSSDNLYYNIFDTNSVDPQLISFILNKDIPEWLEPIVEKKTYDDLFMTDRAYWIWYNWLVKEYYFNWEARSETFLTREEAEDEHKRREWAVRKDKFIPKQWETIFYIWWDRIGLHNKFYSDKFWKASYLLSLIVNFWLAFRTEEELKNAIDSHDLIRLFYTIR